MYYYDRPMFSVSGYDDTAMLFSDVAMSLDDLDMDFGIMFAG